MSGDPSALEAREITATPAWTAYASDQIGESLRDLVVAAGGPSDALLKGLTAAHFLSPTWKRAQHLSLLFAQREFVAEAHVFALIAVELSGGDVLARVTLATSLRLRRFPHAVLHQLDLIRDLARTIRSDKRTFRFLRTYLASNYAWTYGYLDKLRLVRPWAQFLVRDSGAESEALAKVAVVLVRSNIAADFDLALRAIEVLDTRGLRAGRAADIAERILRDRLLSLLSAYVARGTK